MNQIVEPLNQPGQHNPASPALSERERAILQSIIHNFILTASPVGSRALTRRYKMGLSSATVRNIMSDLEELGLLSHPHTSAGRLPTDLGYRMYVDDLMEVERLSDDVRRAIIDRIDASDEDADDLLQRITGAISEVSRLLTVIQAPETTSGTLDKVELVRIASGKLMVVVIVSHGAVRTIMFEIDTVITDEEIAGASHFVNSRIAGMKLIEIPAKISERIGGSANNAVVRLFLDFPRRIFSGESGRITFGGTGKVLEHPEFNTADKMRGIIELIDDKDVIVHLLRDRPQGVAVTIGVENPVEQLRDFSVITSTYRRGDATGTVGVIGPTRMNYSKLVPLVAFTAGMMDDLSE